MIGKDGQIDITTAATEGEAQTAPSKQNFKMRRVPMKCQDKDKTAPARRPTTTGQGIELSQGPVGRVLLTRSTSSNEALALQAELAGDARNALLAGDAIGAKIARNSSRLVAWMDSIPPERLEIELFGYSAHEITRLDYERRAGQALCRGRKYVPRLRGGKPLK